jgi:hypothetical protein
MFGEAFKCDQCGRVAFVPNNQTLAQGGPPPFGWFALSTVGAPDQHWPMWHFDTAMCLAEFTDNMVTIPENSVEPMAEPVTDNPGAADSEVVISEWVAVDEQAG